MYKYIALINSSDTNTLYSLSKFVFKAFKLYVRTFPLYNYVVQHKDLWPDDEINIF